MGRINIEARILSSVGYNANPAPLEIVGVRELHGTLFQELALLPDASARGAYFRRYMAATFGGDHRRGYLRYLLGWMSDSSSPEGAVLKGWVEECFSLAPTYHREPFAEGECPTRALYHADRARLGDGQGVSAQFDLLYEFLQEELRRTMPQTSHLTLYRGVQSLSARTIQSGDEPFILTLNNLNSFTRDFERAWEFGDRVMEVRVPLTKILFDEAALATGVLKGEEELIVLGGQYLVRLRWH